MESTVRLAEVLDRKGRFVLTGPGDISLDEAARRMNEARVGSMVIVDRQGTMEGIITERDVLRRVAQDPDHIRHIRVSEAMSRDVVVAFPEDTCEAALAIMTHRRIRHLPILENGRLTGIVSIGDLVWTLVRQVQYEVRLLRDYISGVYPG